jgi:ABC-2 type transport system permease protein/oleandomycin transport system permease protein
MGGAATSVADSAVVTMRNLRHFWRQPDLLVFSTIQPIMFVVLFVYVFGGAVGLALAPGVTYVDYLLPGIFVQSVTFRASNTAVGLSEDLRRGVIDRFCSMPMARSAVLLGRTTADLVRNVLITGLMIVVGYLVGFRFQAGVLPALASVFGACNVRTRSSSTCSGGRFSNRSRPWPRRTGMS